MRAALVKDGVVINVTVFGSTAPATWDGYTVIASETALVGDLWDGVTFTTPPLVPPVLTRLEVLAAKTSNYTSAEMQELLHILAVKVKP